MPKRDVLAEMSAQEDKVFAEREEQLMQNPAYRELMQQRERKIFVRPAAGRRVPMLDGGYYPEAGMEVRGGDVYTARRLRDGSLELGEKPAEQAQPAEPAPAPAPEPAPAPAPEPAPAPAPEPAPAPAPEQD